MNDKGDVDQIGLIVYGHNFCAQAGMLSRALVNHEVDHEWRDIRNGDPAWQDELRALARGHLSVPTVVFPDGTVMVEPWPKQVLEKLGIKDSGFINRLLGR
jgi:mycoredoxin